MPGDNLSAMPVVIGTAGWSIPRRHAEAFGAGSSTLARYASRFGGTEINSTFYRSHRADTYRRWADTVPESFRFAVKAPKTITHESRLIEAGGAFAAFIDEIAPLGSKTGPILLQLPPKLAFDASSVEPFLRNARSLWGGDLVIEPRHASWFTDAVSTLLAEMSVARVGADPARGPDGLRPAGDASTCYLRLHGSPRVYFSAYGEDMLAAVEDMLLSSRARNKWCIFDNTASGAAAGDALKLQSRLRTSPDKR